jgi:hypothetical protein
MPTPPLLDSPAPHRLAATGQAWRRLSNKGRHFPALRRLAAHAGVRRRFAPPQLRHAHAIELVHESEPAG